MIASLFTMLIAQLPLAALSLCVSSRTKCLHTGNPPSLCGRPNLEDVRLAVAEPGTKEVSHRDEKHSGDSTSALPRA